MPNRATDTPVQRRRETKKFGGARIRGRLKYFILKSVCSEDSVALVQQPATMGTRKGGNPSASLSTKTANKIKRRSLYVEQKKAGGKAKHEERHRRRKEEAKDPELKRQRLEQNQPASIDKKRIWDDIDDDSLGAVVDVAQLKRRRLEAAEAAAARDADAVALGEGDEKVDDDADSMLDSDEEEAGREDGGDNAEKIQSRRAQRTPSLAPSTTSTNLDLTPDSLTEQFGHLFADELPPIPKILVTTSLNATIHKEAEEIAALLPNSQPPLLFNGPRTPAPGSSVDRLRKLTVM